MSAAALDFLRQLSKGESVARDGERLLSVPQLVVFLRGFPHAAFPRVTRGSYGNPAYFPEMMPGLAFLLCTLEQSLGQEPACPVSRT